MESQENILNYDISYKTLIGSKPLQIRFDKIGGIRIYDGTRYLTLFCTRKYDAVYDRIRYLKGLKSSIIYIYIFFLTILQKSKLAFMIFYL